MSLIKNQAWVGVDLDGTLARHDHGVFNILQIGEPIPAMATRVRRWLVAGKRVKIMTARACKHPQRAQAIRAIEQWCEEHFGVILEVTNEKDFLMQELWDDRAIGVVVNTGIRQDGRL